MIRLLKHILLLVLFTFSVNLSLFAQTQKTKDTTKVKKDTLKLRYDFKNTQKGGLFLDDLAKKEVIFDKALNKYVILEKIGDYYTKTPIFLTQREYAKYRLKRDMLQYFKDKVSATNGKKKGADAAQRDLLPEYYVNSKFFESIFGGNSIKVTPTGSLNLKLGFIYQNTENPQISEENRSSLVFDFDQQINASLRAKVGERLEFSANYDTQSTFDFQNLIKIDYTPTEDDILQGIEAGNVAMPIKNSLINGAQSLFGVKAKLQFGNTNVTAVFSQQNSESKTVVAEAGASIEEFELRTTDYDNDRHFFLSQFFIDNYANSLKQYPLISSQVNITRIEVWITNRNATTEDFRSIVAFADIGETNTPSADNNFYSNFVNSSGEVENSTNPITVNANGEVLYLPQNDANTIYEDNILNGIRDVSTVESTLRNEFSMSSGTDYSILENARKLSTNEYRLNSQLGYISLNRRLNDGEVLAVAYEYTVAGTVNGSTQKSFKVGEFSNDGVQAPENLAVKLLRSEILQTVRENPNTGENESFPTWRLMMKNVYALGAFPLTQDGFRFEIQYRDDDTGIASNVLQNANTPNIPNLPLIQVFKLDQLDQSQFRTSDGFFDYVEGVTVNSQNGYVIFPEPEPFGNDLVKDPNNSADIGLDETLDEKFIFKELYLNTKINIQNNFQNKDKYFLKGYFKSESAGGIPIGAFNVPRGSVRVTAGGRQLVEGVDYVVDYQLGRVQIIDPGLRASGTPINVSTENNAVFNQQRKTFMGVDIEHKFSDDFVVGGTVLNVMERPLTPKVNFGSDPINNTMFGVNIDYATEVPYFTKLANKLPFVDTDAPSNISVRADMAYLLPGTPSGIDVAGAATSYIDDFEASQIPISLLSALDWYEASTPKYNDITDRFNGNASGLNYNDKRAKLAWYSIDQIFYGLGDTPASINADELSRAETRQINYSELFPNQQFDITQNTLLRTLDLAYFPEERGSYNFNIDANDVNDNGTLKNPEENWGGIMRPLNTNNFDQANVEFIQFWVMDPYQNYSITPEEGLPAGINPNDISNQVGDLYINLGNVSEDIVKDSRKMFENGLPEDGIKVNDVNVNRTIWGDVPRNPSIIYAFSEEDDARNNQDLGFDGLTDAEELTNLAANLGVDPQTLPSYLINDPASDNFQFFRGGNLDALNASIVRRYKDFNNTQGNSPTLNQSPETYPTSSTTYPDVEDINRDQTMNTVESFYEYKISMNRNDLQKGKNFIVDQKTTTVTLENGNTQETTWYQFRVPIRNGTPINGISDFNSIRFVRMYLTNFKMPVVLRFGELDLVRGDWRRYLKTIDPDIDPSRDLNQAELESFEVGVVSIEQNNGTYQTPPGIERERLQGTTTVQLQNEQSVTLKVNNLEAGKTRAIYKNISVDLRRFKNLQMFMHLQSVEGEAPAADNAFAGVIRLGTDLDENYYELELPLKVSESGNTAEQIWPEENNLNAFLETLGTVKLERDGLGEPINEPYTSQNQGDLPYKVTVKGNPTLAQLRTIVLGLKNTSLSNKSGEVWFNELRSSDFDNEAGWAAVVNADANFADVANVSLSGSMQTIGFGNVEDRVAQRTLDETKQYDISTTVSLGKVLTPQKWGLQIPMSYSIGETFIDPKFDRQYQDVEFSEVKSFFESQTDSPQKEQALENINNSQDYTKRTSISFINVKKNRNPNTTKKPKFYDVENVAVSYSHNREFRRDYNIQKFINENVMASAGYNFNFDAKPIEPFKKNDSLFRSKYWKFLKDLNFNPVPTTLAINSRINRSYNEQQSRNLIEGLSDQPELIQRRFLFDWDYTIGFDLTKSLQLNFNATNNYIYDAFGSGEELQIFDDFFNTGRANQYHQKLNGTYQLPLDKFPFLKFIKADYAYTADFDWQVSSQDQTIAEQIGNVIQNANTHNLNTTFTFDKIYKSIGFERLLLTKTQRKNAKGKNLSRIRPKKNLPIGKQILKTTWGLLTSIKQGKVSYTENNGQYLQGYDEGVGFLGGSPTAFAFGSQVDIRNKALTNGWLVNPRGVDEEYFNKTYSRTHYNKLDYNFTLKPVADLNIDVRGNKIQTKDISQQLDVIAANDPTANPNGILDDTIDTFETGNFSTSHSMFSTAFTDGDALFQTMKDARVEISQRLASENGIDTNDPANINDDGTVKGFGGNSQQVLLPAFMAAYSGKSPTKVNTGLFRNIPIPNWTLRYSGFMKMKWFKKNFSSFVVSHGYKSSYTISNFTNNLQYKDGTALTETNAAGNFESQRLIASATLVDEFSPLIKVDMKMKNSFSFRGEVKRDRTLTMNFNNSTLTDIAGTEYIFGLGYVFKNVKMNTRFTGKKTTLKGDINLRADVSLRDNLTQIRYIDEDNNQISGGQRLFSIKFTADYILSRSLTASFYYNHQTSRFAISTTFPRQAINGGINIVYNLGRN
ncbi:cell surface protein SprA [Polaribacter sp. R77954]|uniref:T9SS outer membrane translocon Sov/SprA n=1 Tax=Polaribacter sp. R77954 TaxID=3093870 RepID=UPI0037C538E1